MSIISSGFFNKYDLISIIKFSNYNAYYNSNREYEPKYYSLITLLHEFCIKSLDYENNGIWKLKIKSIDIDTFNEYFIGAWGNRSNNYSDFVSINYISNAIKYIQNEQQISLTCNESIEYLSNFIKFVFKNQNPWPTLIYFSKFVSTFLPDLAIPFDTASLSKIAREYRINGDARNLSDYIKIHANLKKDILGFLKTNSMTIVDLKELDDNTLIGRKHLFKLHQTPLNRPIDKIYYSV